MEYLHWKEQALSDLSETSITDAYNKGFVFTRLGKGVMHQTRSCRIDLSKFELSSENKRILKKTGDLEMRSSALPVAEYDFKIGKLAKDFYDTKFQPGIMSAQKVKEMLTDGKKSNFNKLLSFFDKVKLVETAIGYAICYQNSEILHYSYPFYDLANSPDSMGLGMMIRAIQEAHNGGLKYIYLGSLQRPADTYKLQFAGLEWFDGKKWQTDLEAAKAALK
jgi:arginyl-tRNA--protein-N-Asp/Glu arginylyltransferase